MVTIIIALYLYYGGSRAVIWTDAIQGIIFSTLMITATAISISYAGGWNSMFDTLASQNPTKATFNSVNIHYYEYLPMCLSFFFLPHVWQRMYMAKSATVVAKNVALLSGVMCILFFCGYLIGTSGLSIFPNGLADGDSLLGAIFAERAPYFGALVLVAAFSAGMSTVDSQLLSASSVVTRDLRSHKQCSEQKNYKFARQTTIALLALVYIWSLFLKSRSIMSLIMLGIGLNVIFFPVVFGIFYWKRASAAAAFWSLTTSLLTFLTVEFLPQILPETEQFFNTLKPASWALIVSILSFVTISYLTNGSAHDAKRAEFSAILSGKKKAIKKQPKQQSEKKDFSKIKQAANDFKR